MERYNFQSILANNNKYCKESSARPNVVLGLTGGMAAGKSLVAEIIKNAGISVIDTDDLAKKASAPGGPCLDRLARRLGGQILNADGTLDRKKLLQMIITDAGVKGEVEKIIHPEVLRRLNEILTRLCRAGRKMVVVEVPLLFEAGWSGLFDRIICVTAPREERIRRVMKRNRVDRHTAGAWIDLQLDQEKKSGLSDFVIVNDDGKDLLKRRVADVLSKLNRLYPGML